MSINKEALISKKHETKRETKEKKYSDFDPSSDRIDFLYFISDRDHLIAIFRNRETFWVIEESPPCSISGKQHQTP